MTKCFYTLFYRFLHRFADGLLISIAPRILLLSIGVVTLHSVTKQAFSLTKIFTYLLIYLYIIYILYIMYYIE